MKSMRQLNRDLKNIAGRIIKDDQQGKLPNPTDLEDLKDTVGLIIDIMRVDDANEG